MCHTGIIQESYSSHTEIKHESYRSHTGVKYRYLLCSTDIDRYHCSVFVTTVLDVSFYIDAFYSNDHKM
jgi:hypothetical protein